MAPTAAIALNHAGSVYAFSGATPGPRARFFSGWALIIMAVPSLTAAEGMQAAGD